ncbi:MAG: hypothetical protein ACLFUS_14015 [Candidatus Sumerlaeia bacterium]
MPYEKAKKDISMKDQGNLESHHFILDLTANEGLYFFGCNDGLQGFRADPAKKQQGFYPGSNPPQGGVV